jgi:transcription antitermination factor NusG
LFFNGGEDERVSALTTNRIVSTLVVPDQAMLIRELRQIQHLLSTGSEFQWGPAIKIGDWARVIAGPLSGLEGIVQGRLSRMRLILNVNMLSQSVSVEVAQELLERIDPPMPAASR